MGQVTANPRLPDIDFCGRNRNITAPGFKADPAAQPVFDGGDLVVAELMTRSNFFRHHSESVRLAVTTGQQVSEHGIGKLLHIDKLGPRLPVYLFRGDHIGGGGNSEDARRRYQALTKIAVAIRKLDHGRSWIQIVFFAGNLLLTIAARTQHQHEGRRYRNFKP